MALLSTEASLSGDTWCSHMMPNPDPIPQRQRPGHDGVGLKSALTLCAFAQIIGAHLPQHHASGEKTHQMSDRGLEVPITEEFGILPKNAVLHTLLMTGQRANQSAHASVSLP